MVKKKYIYKVYHGNAFPEYVISFKTVEEVIYFIESQCDPECWCYEKEILQ